MFLELTSVGSTVLPPAVEGNLTLSTSLRRLPEISTVAPGVASRSPAQLSRQLTSRTVGGLGALTPPPLAPPPVPAKATPPVVTTPP